MANKNLIRRMRQLLILVLILAMTMSFATMTAMAFDNSAQGNTVTIPVNKTWDDEGHENERPSEITVNLMNGNTKAGFVKLNAANGWNGCFTVPATDEKVTYTVSEEPVANYRCTVIQQPVADYFGVSSFGTKVTPASKNDYIFDGDLIIANHGGDYYIWTKEPVTIQKQRLMDLINNANLEGLGEVLSEKNTKFASGFSAVFERQQGKETITVTINSEADGNHIIFSKEKAWSLFYCGTLEIEEVKGAIVKNTYVPQTSKDETGMLQIEKQVVNTEGVAVNGDSTEFTFSVETANNEPVVLIETQDAADEYNFVKVGETGSEATALKLKSGDKIKINGLPAGNYNVKEDQAEGYTLRTIDGEKVEGQSKQYEVKSQETTRSLFVNEKANSVQEDETGMLQIEKQVVNTEGVAVNGDSTEFTFSVETANNEPVVLIETQDAADEYNFVKVGETGSEATALKLKSGDKIKINGLPAGNYNVKEDQAEGYTLRTIDGEKVEGQSKQYEVKSQETTRSLFVNEKANSVQEDMTGTLKIKKMVLDTDGDYTIDDNTIFTFTVETAGDAKKALVLEPSETRKDEYQFVEAVNEGGTELKLKSGDEITIKGLPAREYTVIEKQTDGYTLVEIDGVKVSNQTSKAYTLAEKGEERALFTNQQNKPDTEPPGENGNGNGGGDSGGGGLVTPPQKPLPPEGNLEIPETPVEPDTPAEPVEPSEKPLPDDKHTVTEVPKTGDAGADALALNLLLLSISALTGMAFYLRRKTTNR